MKIAERAPKITCLIALPLFAFLLVMPLTHADIQPDDWLDTGANNSLVEDDTLFEEFDLGGEQVFGTASTLTNIHSHYTAATFDAAAGFEYTGRMMMTDASGGIGITFMSQYPISDTYYRLRRFGNKSFHISPHSTSVAGDIETNLTPLPNTWYSFKVQVQDTGSRTEIKAKVWAEGSSEPSDWQVNCYDDNSTRLTDGAMGLWGYSSGSKYWDDLAGGSITPLPQYSLTANENPAGSGSVGLDPAGGTYNAGTVVELTATPAAGWEFNGWSGDLSGATNPVSLTMTGDYTVTANFEPDSTPPVISSILVSPLDTSATVSWQTNEPTTAVVDYGETTAYELGSVPDANLVQDHTVTLTGLFPGTTYHLQITVFDDSGHETTSSDVVFSTSVDLSGIDSDDFSTTALNTDIWTFVDPVGDGQVSMTGTQLEISVPAGTSHDIWASGNFAPRVMQAAADEDFEIEVKLESAVSEPYQLQGLLVEESPGNFLRLGFYSDGSNTRVFAAEFIGGSPTVRINQSISPAIAPLYLRVTRAGDSWTQRYSLDGINWSTGAVFSRSLAVTAVGVYAGNAGGSAPAHTAVVDYFFNTISPIIPEDGVQSFTLTVDVTGSGNVVKNPDQAVYTLGDTVELTAIPASGWSLGSWGGDASGLENPFTLTVDDDKNVTANFVLNTTPPIILTQPVDQAVSEGQTATFSVTASGSGTLSYQWERDEVAIPGATGSSYTTPEVTLADDGALFRCVVTNAEGSTTSDEALLTVSPAPLPPTIDSQPVDQTVDEGQTATFSVTASGSGSLTYQWQRDGEDITGAMGSIYTTPAVNLSDDGALFRCVVTNAGGSTTSGEALLTVLPAPPTIVAQPVDQTVSEGQTATFSVTATGSGTLTYQWQRDGIPIPGATGSSYAILSVALADDGALFRCVVANAEGATNSNEALLTVLPPNLRVTDGQVVLYDFKEGGGVTVEDVSLVEPALDLTIQDGAAVSWLPAGRLAVNSPTVISSLGAATKVIDAVKASGEISIETWITPANTIQDGPARVVTLSQDSANRNFTLGQGQWSSLPSTVYDMRLRTTATSLNGTPSIKTPAGSVATALTHVVYTRDAAGQANLYLDGIPQASGTVVGDVSNWDEGYALALGNELDGARPWLGTYYLVAIFDRALSQAEVQQNYDAGPIVQSLISDDFNSCELNQMLWTFVDPMDAGNYAMSGGGSGEAILQLSVPDGVEYSASGAGGVNETLRVMQSAVDENLEIEVKFRSIPSFDYHTEGILIAQDLQTWLHFDVYHDAGQLYARAGIMNGGSTNTFFDTLVPVGPELYLLVSRVGDQWTFWYSGDGTNWSQLGNPYSQALAVSEVGVFAANPNVASAFTAEVDYFFNTAAPILPEDGDSITLTANSRGFGEVSITPDRPSYLCGETVWLTAVPDDGWSFIDWSGDLSGSNNPESIIMDEDKVVTGNFTSPGPVIDVWHGFDQEFGSFGQPQRWVNILGNVTDPEGVASLNYTLNGSGPPVSLRLGPDNRRLALPGDFNADLDIDDLIAGQNNLVLTAMDVMGNETTETVTVDFQPAPVWPLPYAIDWSALATPEEIQDVAQVVDGEWRLENGNVRTAEPGYDRLIAIGDMTWEDYEVTVPITLNSKPGFYGVGVLLRWNGHTDVPVVTSNPKSGWFPLGAILWVWGSSIQIYGNDGEILDSENRSFSIGTTYWIKARVETVPGVGGLYRMKVWENGQPEPATWDLTGQEQLSDPQEGSMMLLAHQVDVSFGNVVIQPIN